MRICMIASTPFPPAEGIGFYTWNLAKQLYRRGHKVQIVTRGGAQRTHHQVVDGIDIWRPTFVPLYPFHVHVHSWWVNQLVKQLEDEVDLFHLHTPLVKRPHTKRPFLVTVHTPMKADAAAVSVDSLLGWLIKMQAPISYRLEQDLFDHAAGLTAVSHSVAAEMNAYGIDPQRVRVLGNGVDTTFFGPPPPGQKPPTERYALTVARLAPRKGIADLVAAAEIVARQDPSFRFFIAGSGPMEKDLQSEIERRKLGNQVKLLGHIQDRRQLADLYRNATLFIHPAHYEGLPTVLLEAMACGRPVISTAVSGALDVIQPEGNGLLVPPHNPVAIADATLHLLKNGGQAESFGQAAHRTIEERYSWSRVSENYMKAYAAVM